MPCSASTGGGVTDGGAISALSAMLSVGVSRKLVLTSTLRKRRMELPLEYRIFIRPLGGKPIARDPCE